MRRKILLLLIVGCIGFADRCVYSQFASKPESYANYYNNHLKNFHRPPTNLRDYTIDKYFYHRPTLSPYVNLPESGQKKLPKYAE